ncbi:MAG TPA: YciI family protein [Ignavibacteriaceae bacterium]|nr:YciI family protein [Ignavibacteriaceae bacterium]
MKEFMLLIRNQIDHQSDWTEKQNKEFLKACEVYIGRLKNEGKLISAQPLIREGKMISGSKGDWKDGPFNETKEVIVGYYHVLANDINEAASIAKQNPEFEYGKRARIEVRPIKTKEEKTGFVYPEKAEKSL